MNKDHWPKFVDAALDLSSPGEAAMALDKGMATGGIKKDDRNVRMAGEAKKQTEADRQASLARAQKMFSFHGEYKTRFPKRDHPVKELFAVYEAGGWAALDSLHAKLDAEKEARMPPPRGPYTKAPIKQL
jgi:hypothetical protein